MFIVHSEKYLNLFKDKHVYFDREYPKKLLGNILISWAGVTGFVFLLMGVKGSKEQDLLNSGEAILVDEYIDVETNKVISKEQIEKGEYEYLIDDTSDIQFQKQESDDESDDNESDNESDDDNINI